MVMLTGLASEMAGEGAGHYKSHHHVIARHCRSKVICFLKVGSMKTICVLTLFVVVHVSTQGQSLSDQVIASAGNYAVAGVASLESTTGEVVIPTVEANGFILTQGFHQPLYVGIPISVDEADQGEIIAYPNPVSDLLTINSSSSLTGMVVHLYDAAGKLIYTDRCNGRSTSIPFSNTASGLYLLQVHGQTGEIHFQTKITHVN